MVKRVREAMECAGWVRDGEEWVCVCVHVQGSEKELGWLFCGKVGRTGVHHKIRISHPWARKIMRIISKNFSCYGLKLLCVLYLQNLMGNGCKNSGQIRCFSRLQKSFSGTLFVWIWSCIQEWGPPWAKPWHEALKWSWTHAWRRIIGE